MRNETKAEIRQRVRARIQSVATEQRGEASAHACALLQQQTVWNRAQSILFYAPLPDELDISLLWAEARAQGKRILLPRFSKEAGSYEVCEMGEPSQTLRAGRFGILEPNAACVAISVKHLDLALVPGVAFDAGGRRLGRGRGFYDRLLTDMNALKCGVAFDEQVEPAIPVEQHDVRVDYVLTPTRWLLCGQGEVVK